MDETACWFEMLSDTTVASTGSRSVPLKTTGHKKDHFTVILSARADGKKLKPFIVFKGKGTPLHKELEKKLGVVVQFSGNRWMSNGLTCDYLKKITGSFFLTKRLIIWDAYKCPTSDETLKQI